MQDDRKTLEDLNVKIGEMEHQGDRDALYWLNSILAPQLAFRRADAETFDDRGEFLMKVKSREPRETEIVSIDLHGDRAIVECIVTVKYPDRDEKFHNLRLFVRHEEQWKLLGWANEPV
jgi:hypothetical protein